MAISKDIKNVCFIVQCRKNSTRVPNKMLRPFANSNLFRIAIEKILKSKIIPKDNFYVSVMDEEFVEIAQEYNINIFKRSADSTQEPVELHTVFEWHKDLSYEYYININACNPLLTVESIDSFVTEFLNSDSSGMFGVVEKKTFFFNRDGNMISNFWGEDKYLATLETKFVESIYEAAHSLYAGKMEDIANGIYMGSFKKPGDPHLFILNEEECFDIDWPWQFEIAENLYKCRQ